ncbi:MAG TPA: HesA/MoeB/ThiF family protein, partial [Alphaproteobacteria bacterium]|nr:HesA/MoeB/ThiF family protein [Alphaproteobacteria bacterium]
MTTARYARQTRLPGFGPAQQEQLAKARILAVGAGGLGAVFLPVLAGAGVGHITIVDPDTIDISNLHRQTIYTTDQIGQPKAASAAAYLKALNPDVDVAAFHQKIEGFEGNGPYDLILDGTDNFAAKSFINEWALAHATPLIAASVNGFEGQCGIFAGHDADAPCYRCLFPDLPDEAPNCATAGILGSVPGIAGQYQAHLALLYLTGLGDMAPGTFLQFDYMGLRSTRLRVPKTPRCPCCAAKTQPQP